MINGLIYSIRQMINYLKQLELGLAGGVVLELYGPLAKKNDHEVSRVLSASRHFYNQTGLFFLIGSVTLAIVYPFIVDCGELPWYYVTTLVLLFGLSGAISFFLVSSYQVLLTADQRSYVLSLVGSGIGILTLAITVFAVLYESDILVIPVISVVGVLMTAWILYLVARNLYGNRFQFDLPADATAIPQRSAVFLNQISFVVEMNAPIMIATLMLGLTSVSVLALYNMVFYALRSMTKTIPRSLQASFGELFAIGHDEDLQKAHSEYEYLYMLLVGWFYTTAAILLLPFMRVYTQGITDADYERPVLGVLMIVVAVLGQLNGPCATIVAAAGKYREINRNAIQSALIGVALGCLGAYLAGLTGLLVGFVISAAYRSVFIIHYCHLHLLRSPIKTSLLRVLRNCLFSVVAWLPFTLWVQIETNSLWLWFAWAIGVFAWAGVIFLIGNISFDLPTARNIRARFSGAFRNLRR